MRILQVLAIVVCTCTVAHAMPVATLEVFDDPGFTQRTGVMANTTKTLYVRMRLLQNNSLVGYLGLEFSLLGLHDFSTVMPTYTHASGAVLGSVVAPADTLSGAGGINVAWPECQTEELVMTLTLTADSPPTNRTIRVARRFPPRNPLFSFPFHTGCDEPCDWCVGEIGGDAYVLNPLVPLETRSWAVVKTLYR